MCLKFSNTANQNEPSSTSPWNTYLFIHYTIRMGDWKLEKARLHDSNLEDCLEDHNMYVTIIISQNSWFIGTDVLKGINIAGKISTCETRM